MIEVKLLGTDGNAFSIIGKVSKALTENGESERAQIFTREALDCQSYNELLNLVRNYVEVV